MVRNDTHKRSAAEQPKKSDTPGASTGKGQAGSEALSLLQNSLIIPPDDSKFEFITSDGEIIDLKDYKATFEFYSWQYKLPEVSGFKMARLV